MLQTRDRLDKQKGEHSSPIRWLWAQTFLHSQFATVCLHLFEWMNIKKCFMILWSDIWRSASLCSRAWVRCMCFRSARISMLFNHWWVNWRKSSPWVYERPSTYREFISAHSELIISLIFTWREDWFSWSNCINGIRITCSAKTSCCAFSVCFAIFSLLVNNQLDIIYYV